MKVSTVVRLISKEIQNKGYLNKEQNEREKLWPFYYITLNVLHILPYKPQFKIEQLGKVVVWAATRITLPPSFQA